MDSVTPEADNKVAVAVGCFKEEQGRKQNLHPKLNDLAQFAFAGGLSEERVRFVQEPFVRRQGDVPDRAGLGTRVGPLFQERLDYDPRAM